MARVSAGARQASRAGGEHATAGLTRRDHDSVRVSATSALAVGAGAGAIRSQLAVAVHRVVDM
jgi:hypothetical protein